jgi:hypothetical protein
MDLSDLSLTQWTEMVIFSKLFTETIAAIFFVITGLGPCNVTESEDLIAYSTAFADY